MKQNAFGDFRPQWPMESTGKRERFRNGDPSKTILASTRFLWAQSWTRNISVLPTTPLALPLHGFDSCYSSSIDKFGRNFRRLGAMIAQYFTGQFWRNP
jgi:hypothetical protein